MNTTLKLTKITRLTGFASIILIALAGYIVFYATPIEYYQGIAQKIMYIHVPSVLMAYLAFLLCFVCSIAYLRSKKESFDIVAAAAAELGALLMAICLITGSIWGKPTWNTYWTWDARLTISLIVFLIFSGYCLFRAFAGKGLESATAAAVVAIIGFLSVPLNHMAVTWWRTLHQPSTVFSRGNSMSPEFAFALWWSVAAFFALFLYLLLLRISLERLQRRELQSRANIML